MEIYSFKKLLLGTGNNKESPYFQKAQTFKLLITIQCINYSNREESGVIGIHERPIKTYGEGK